MKYCQFLHEIYLQIDPLVQLHEAFSKIGKSYGTVYLEESHLAVEKIGKLFTARKVQSSDSQTEIQLELERKENQ